MGDPHERLLRFLFVVETDRQEVVVGALPSRPLVELHGGNVVGDDPNLVQVFRQRLRASLGEVPFDARLLGFDKDADRDSLGLGLGERVGGQLVGERRLVVLVVGDRRLLKSIKRALD